jgi:hypothetical protein
MKRGKAILAALVLCGAGVALALIFGGSGSGNRKAEVHEASVPGKPSIEIISPRNGSRQQSRAAMVKVVVENFDLAPAHFGDQPELGEGNIRYSLNRVPDCVDPVKLQRAINSPLGKGRLVGKSMDYPAYSGPNGILAERVGSAGSYSPGTRPTIFYHELPPGFYRLIVALAQNNGATATAHDVTTFQVLPKPGHGPKPCTGGKVSSTQAAANLR